MSIFPSHSASRKDTLVPPAAAEPPAPPVRDAPPQAAAFEPATPPAPVARSAPAPQPDLKESLIASDLTIEGKIEGTGHVRIAGRFKGDVNVQGNLRIENGARLNGGVKAKQVVVAGELEGNIDSASRVELLDSAVLVGDIKAGTLTVAPGSRIRGHIECGWDGKESGKPGGKGDKADSDTAP